MLKKKKKDGHIQARGCIMWDVANKTTLAWWAAEPERGLGHNDEIHHIDCQLFNFSNVENCL